MAKRQTPKKQQKKGTTFSTRARTIQVRGQGGYTLKEIVHKVMSALPKGTFASVGSAVGGMIGGPSGAMLGNAAGKGLAMATGYGDYILNDIVHRSGGIPKADPNIARRVVHSEFIQDITSPGTPFTVGVNLAVNPGDPNVFPWLAPIAQRFAKFKFSQLIFEFRSSSSDYSTGSSLGTVILAPNYNPLAPAPATKAAMEAMTGAVSAKPSNGMYAGIECSSGSGNPIRWIRNPALNTISQLTDICDFYVATSGLSAASATTLGELWVHYAVDLFEPYYSPTLALASVGSMVRLTSADLKLYNTNGWGNATPSACSWTDINTSAPAALQCYVGPGQPPVNKSYLFSLQSDAATGTGVLWFGRPGLYLLESSQPNVVNFTATATDLWTYTISDASATLTKVYADNALAAVSYAKTSWKILILQPGTALTTVYNSTGNGATASSNFRYNTITVLT